MVYKTTYFVPWEEAWFIELLDGNEHIHLRSEDTTGRVYESTSTVVNLESGRTSNADGN